MNTAAVQNPTLITEAAQRFGSQCVVLAIDARRIKDQQHKWQVCIKAGSEPTDIDAVEWAAKGEQVGAGEILLTSMDADGTRAGYDNELNKAISDAVTIPVIASGGAGTLDHLYDAIVVGGADAVLMASITHFGNYTIKQIKEYLATRGLPMNL
jgi:cyclase